jgi:Subtilase family
MRTGDYFRSSAKAALAASLMTMAACGGGGGGSGASTSTPPSSPITTPTKPATPSITSAEYTQNYGLAAIHAEAAWQAGATGSGVTVAVIDSGVDHTQADLAVNVSPQSTDVFTSRNAPDGQDNHGTLVAGIIASAFNGFGTVGVAYNATILGVRTDTPGSCTTGGTGKSTCTFDDAALATGINYAVAHGARVINLSLGGPGGPDNFAFQNAMQAAVNAGVVFAIASGNEGAATPDYPAMFAIDPRFKGYILAVGATDQNNALASYSNRAGTAASEFVAAPGDKVITGCTGASCYQASGTSFAAPAVAGSLALLLQGFPNLNGAQAIALLIKTADPLATGTSSDYGAGLINLQKAFAPVGTLSLPTTDGGLTVVPSNALGSTLSGAFGGTVARSHALSAAAYDSYHRLFVINLASAYRSPSRASYAAYAETAPRPVSVNFSLAPGTSLNFSATKPVLQDNPDPLRRVGLWADQDARSDVSLSFNAGALSLAAWRGKGGMAPSSLMAGARDGFASLAAPDTAVRSGYRLGAFSLTSEMGQGRATAPFSQRAETPSRYSLAGLDWQGRDATLGIGFGRLSEPQGPLGGYLQAGSFYGMSADTRFVSLRGDWRAPSGPVEGLRLSADASLGRTTATGAFLSLASGALSSSWRVVAVTPCRRDDCAGLTLSLSQPVRMEQGHFTAVLPATPKTYFGPILFTERRIDAAPAGRQIDLRLTAFKLVPDMGRLELTALATRQENNMVGAPLNLGLIGAWRSSF